MTFDLTGLPPTPEEIDAFVEDAVGRRLREGGGSAAGLARPSASAGAGTGSTWPATANRPAPARNVPYPHAWRYRDYVIDAFNSDKPYDQFIREQIAGDLLPASSDAGARSSI